MINWLLGQCDVGSSNGQPSPVEVEEVQEEDDDTTYDAGTMQGYSATVYSNCHWKDGSSNYIRRAQKAVNKQTGAIMGYRCSADESGDNYAPCTCDE